MFSTDFTIFCPAISVFWIAIQRASNTMLLHLPRFSVLEFAPIVSLNLHSSSLYTILPPSLANKMSCSILRNYRIGLVSSDFRDEARVTIRPALTKHLLIPAILLPSQHSRQQGAGFQRTDSRARLPGFESQPHRIPAVGLWAGYSSALCLHVSHVEWGS